MTENPAEPQSADAEPLVIVLQPDPASGGLNIRLSPDQRDELAYQLRMAELPVRHGIEESAQQVLEIVTTFVGPLVGVLGVRALPKEAWTALGQVLTALINKNDGRRIEIQNGPDQKIVIENDRRAVRETVELLIPAIRDRMILQQDQWDEHLRIMQHDNDEDPPANRR